MEASFIGRITYNVSSDSYKHNLKLSRPFQDALLAYAKIRLCPEGILALYDLYQITKLGIFKIGSETLYFDHYQPKIFTRKVAKYLYDTYISKDSKTQINISYNANKSIEELRERFPKLLEKANDNLLCQEVWPEIYHLIGILERFVLTSIMPGFKQWVTEPPQKIVKQSLLSKPLEIRDLQICKKEIQQQINQKISQSQSGTTSTQEITQKISRNEPKITTDSKDIETVQQSPKLQSSPSQTESAIFHYSKTIPPVTSNCCSYKSCCLIL